MGIISSYIPISWGYGMLWHHDRGHRYVTITKVKSWTVLNSAIDSATVDFSRGAFQLVVSETERAAKDEQERAMRTSGDFMGFHQKTWGSI